MATNDGGPAFPVTGRTEHGMSLRDYFATKAMAAMIGAITEMNDIGIISNRPRDISELAYLYADTMLDERAKAEA